MHLLNNFQHFFQVKCWKLIDLIEFFNPGSVYYSLVLIDQENNPGSVYLSSGLNWTRRTILVLFTYSLV